MSNTTVTLPATAKKSVQQIQPPSNGKNKPQKDDLVEIGGLWAKDSASGKEYFTGEVMRNGVKEQIVVFRNGFKQHENMPDWRIYLRPPLDGQLRNNTKYTSSLKTPVVSAENLNRKVDTEVETENSENQDQEDLSGTL